MVACQMIIAATPEARRFYEAVGFASMEPVEQLEPHPMQIFKCPV